MNLQNWVEQARAHWKEFLPKRFKEFQEAGILESALQEAAERTHYEMTQLENAGLTNSEAWERVREEYLFLPPEASNKKPERTPNVSARMFDQTQSFKSQLLRSLKDEG